MSIYHYVFLFFILLLLLFIIDKYEPYDYSPHIYSKIGLAETTKEYILPEFIPDFITEKEKNYILDKTKDKFVTSGLYLNKNTDNIRKSQTAWISKHNATIKNIIMRVCEKTNLPFQNAEDMQVTKYEPGGYFTKHYDTTHEFGEHSDNFYSLGGHRVATMIIYLNDDFEGGETEFVNLQKKIQPIERAGILFYSLDKNREQCHPYSLHQGNPVSLGNKYIVNIWMRQNKFIYPLYKYLNNEF
jgi:prolyl 4-hydroxylase